MAHPLWLYALFVFSPGNAIPPPSLARSKANHQINASYIPVFFDSFGAINRNEPLAKPAIRIICRRNVQNLEKTVKNAAASQTANTMLVRCREALVRFPHDQQARALSAVSGCLPCSTLQTAFDSSTYR
jgi:hypothetical protein